MKLLFHNFSILLFFLRPEFQNDGTKKTKTTTTKKTNERKLFSKVQYNER